MTTIQSGCLAPENIQNRSRAVFLQPSPPGNPLALSPMRMTWDLRASADGSYCTLTDHSGNFLSVDSAGTVVDTFPADDGSGRQRWVLAPVLGAANKFTLMNFGGMGPAAPRFLSRMGHLKTKMRKNGAEAQCAWIVIKPSGGSEAQKPQNSQKPQKPAAPPSGPLAPRDVLLEKRGGRALKLLRESPQFCMWAETGDLKHMQTVVDTVERVWNLYIQKLKFVVKADVAAKQGWDRYKKPLYLSGSPPPGPCCDCPHSGEGFEYQGWTDDAKAFLVTGGFGDGCLAHELAHLMQVAAAGFSWGGPDLPWAFESTAQFCRWHGCESQADAESIKPWLQYHMTSIERHDGAAQCYQYGSWYWWIFLDNEFGEGTVGRVWSEARAPETPLQASARIAGVPLPDLFARWVASLLSSSPHYRAGERWGRVNAHIGHVSAWNTFEPLRELEGGRYAPAPAQHSLEKGGFHALRLSDGKARGPKRLRLDPGPAADCPEWRMIVVVDGKVAEILKAGAASKPVPLAKATVGVCVTGALTSALPPNGQSYTVTALD